MLCFELTADFLVWLDLRRDYRLLGDFLRALQRQATRQDKPHCPYTRVLDLNYGATSTRLWSFRVVKPHRLRNVLYIIRLSSFLFSCVSFSVNLAAAAANWLLSLKSNYNRVYTEDRQCQLCMSGKNNSKWQLDPVTGQMICSGG